MISRPAMNPEDDISTEGGPATTGAGLDVGMFGKHPTAADHLEDTGLETPALAAFKQRFYVDALGACIARRVWEPPPSGELPYDHGLLTVDACGWTLARFVGARDAAGRGLYPFVACLGSADHGWLASERAVWPWLEEKTLAARQAADPAALSACQTLAREEIAVLAPRWREQQSLDAPARQRWSADHRPGPAADQGLDRVVHALSPEGAGAARVRVPLAGDDPAAAAVSWTSFVLWSTGAPAVTVVWGRGPDAVADLAPGEPHAALFYDLFSGESKVPLTTAVPFHIADATRRRTAAALADWLSADCPLFPFAPAPVEPGSFLGQFTASFRQWWRSSTPR